MVRRRAAILLVLWIGLWGLSGCLVRRREKIAKPAAPIAWQNASLQELLERIQSRQEAIQTLNATATIEPSVSSPAKGEIVHYRDVRTFILIREPAFIRVVGLYPVVQNKAFDMVSDGESFRLYIPSKNRFIIGRDNDERRSKSAMENLRPQVILDALMLKGPEPGKELAVYETRLEGGTSYYVVHVIRAAAGRPAVLSRNIWFERQGLSVTRVSSFDDSGEEVTDVRYSSYAAFAGVSYPRVIVIDRPKDLYGLQLSIESLELNQPLADDKFTLEQPPGTELTGPDQQPLPKKENNVG